MPSHYAAILHHFAAENFNYIPFPFESKNFGAIIFQKMMCVYRSYKKNSLSTSPGKFHISFVSLNVKSSSKFTLVKRLLIPLFVKSIYISPLIRYIIDRLLFPSFKKLFRADNGFKVGF